VKHLSSTPPGTLAALPVWLTLVLSAPGCQQTKDGQSRFEASSAEAAPAQSKSELDTPLAKIDDLVITLGELEERINRQSPYVRARYTSLEQKKEFLDNLIRFEVLAKEAFRRGLDRDPEVVRTMKQVMIQKLINQEFDTKVTPDSIGDAELQASYQANLGEYVKAEEVRASAIIFTSRAQAERVLVEAKGDAGSTNKGFRDLVAKYSSDDETKLRGGDLRYFTADSKELPAAVVSAAFALPQVGDISAVIDAGDGKFYVLKQTNRRQGSTRSFEEAKPAIRNTLFRNKRLAAQNAFIDGLRATAKIEIDEASLEKVRVEPPAAGGSGETPPPGLGSTTPPGTTAPAAAPEKDPKAP
jgi:peptidyl-prolyl cis-trans isomerase C